MIIEKIILLFSNLIATIFSIFPIPDTPQFIINGIDKITNIINYAVTFLNLLYGHTMIVSLCQLFLAFIVALVGYKIFMYVVGFVKGWI